MFLFTTLYGTVIDLCNNRKFNDLWIFILVKHLLAACHIHHEWRSLKLGYLKWKEFLQSILKVYNNCSWWSLRCEMVLSSHSEWICLRNLECFRYEDMSCKKKCILTEVDQYAWKVPNVWRLILYCYIFFYNSIWSHVE